MRFWRSRRRRGRHELGPAVTALPSAPSAAPPVVLPAQPASPRVELGFRDGSTAALDPASAQAQALSDLARSLRSAP